MVQPIHLSLFMPYPILDGLDPACEDSGWYGVRLGSTVVLPEIGYLNYQLLV